MMEMGSFRIDKDNDSKIGQKLNQQQQEDLNVDIDIEDLDLYELKDEDKFFLI